MHAECLSGCTCVTTSLFGKPGNNPYCHHRALEMQRVGLRERVVLREAAPGAPFDHGLFELIAEPLPAAPESVKENHLMSSLVPCLACRRHIRSHEPRCCFCGVERTPLAAPQQRALPKDVKRATLFALGLTLAGQACAEENVVAVYGAPVTPVVEPSRPATPLEGEKSAFLARHW